MEESTLGAHANSGMTIEDAGEDHVAHRQRRIECLGRPAAGVAQRPGTGPADLALPSRRHVQAQRQVERRGGGPERLVFGSVVAPILGRILGDHGTRQAQAGGAPESARRCLPDGRCLTGFAPIAAIRESAPKGVKWSRLAALAFVA